MQIVHKEKKTWISLNQSSTHKKFELLGPSKNKQVTSSPLLCVMFCPPVPSYCPSCLDHIFDTLVGDDGMEDSVGSTE